MAGDDVLVAEIEALGETLARAKASINRRFIGQEQVVDLVLSAMLCGGHALLVGLPGLGKTRLVDTLGTVMGLKANRVQFTPDLMPADILGSEVLETAKDGSRAFRFLEGPVFCQLLMADEINRASPRTQSALLEAMQERQVSVAGAARPLPRPFHVLATQNPIEQEGTYPLPEAQLDRFLLQIDIDFPSLADERRVLVATTGAEDPAPEPVLKAADLIEAQMLLTHMPVPEGVVDAILRAVRALRPGPENPGLLWGPGPRGGQALITAARARAFLQGRAVPLLEDVAALLQPALGHRVQLGFAARSEGRTVADLIRTIESGLE